MHLLQSPPTKINNEGRIIIKISPMNKSSESIGNRWQYSIVNYTVALATVPPVSQTYYCNHIPDS